MTSRLQLLSLAAAALLLANGGPWGGLAADDPLAYFVPWIMLSESDRARVDAGAPVVRLLPTRDGQLAILAVSRVDAPAEALIAWARTACRSSTSSSGRRRTSGPASRWSP